MVSLLQSINLFVARDRQKSQEWKEKEYSCKRIKSDYVW